MVYGGRENRNDSSIGLRSSTKKRLERVLERRGYIIGDKEDRNISWDVVIRYLTELFKKKHPLKR